MSSEFGSLVVDMKNDRQDKIRRLSEWNMAVRQEGELQIMSAFSGKTLMITGGTGSFGNTVLKHFL